MLEHATLRNFLPLFNVIRWCPVPFVVLYSRCAVCFFASHWNMIFIIFFVFYTFIKKIIFVLKTLFFSFRVATIITWVNNRLLGQRGKETAPLIRNVVTLEDFALKLLFEIGADKDEKLFFEKKRTLSSYHRANTLRPRIACFGFIFGRPFPARDGADSFSNCSFRIVFLGNCCDISSTLIDWIERTVFLQLLWRRKVPPRAMWLIR